MLFQALSPFAGKMFPAFAPVPSAQLPVHRKAVVPSSSGIFDKQATVCVSETTAYTITAKSRHRITPLAAYYIYGFSGIVVYRIRFLSVVSLLGGVFHSGQAMMKPRAFDVTLDAATVEICTQIKEHCGLDIEKLVTNLPDVNEPVRLINRAFSLDAAAFRKMMNEIRDEYYAQDNRTMGLICYFLGAYLSGFEKCDILQLCRRR